jgi:hypothetical protein
MSKRGKRDWSYYRGDYSLSSNLKSEMTDEEKKEFDKFLMLRQLSRLSDRFNWHTMIVKMQIRIADDEINNLKHGRT